MAAIPLSWNDPMFSGVTSSGSVTLRDGGTISNKSITDSGNIASVVGQGSFTVNQVRIDSREGVRLGGVRPRVSKRRIDAALGRAGVAADRVDLRDDGDVGADVECLDGRAHTGAARADDDDVVLRLHEI